MVEKPTEGNPYKAPIEIERSDDVKKRLPSGTSSDGNAVLRGIAFSAFGVLLLHLAAIPLLFGIGAVFWLGSNEGLINVLRIMSFTALITIAVLCVSTQFYLASKRK